MTEETQERQRLSSLKYKANNREYMKAYSKKWRQDNKDKVVDTRLKHKYGITLDDYNEMFAIQEGCCGICGKHQSELNTKLHVDHCHESGKVRSLLCGNCNIALGLVNEDANILLAMLGYINEN